MRFVLFLALLVASVIAARGADVEFLRVWPGWRDAESFERIREYFGGEEETRTRGILRTQAEERGGFYFLVRVKNAAAVRNATFELSVIRPDTPEPKTYRFPATVPEKETVFHLGLTGSDWPLGEEANPVAWKLTLVSPDGQVLAEHKSFLWEKPAQ